MNDNFKFQLYFLMFLFIFLLQKVHTNILFSSYPTRLREILKSKIDNNKLNAHITTILHCIHKCVI